MSEEMNDNTLDPPGSIAVLGTTPIGIEAALYGRSLGYDVRLFAGLDRWLTPQCAREDCRRIGPTFHNDWFANEWLRDLAVPDKYEEALPMMPDRCLSSLACSAIVAQREDALRVLPSTMRQWIEDGLWQITQTDLLRKRTFVETFVDSIVLVPVDVDDNPDDEELPPDFRLHLSGKPMDEEFESYFDCECVIVAGLPVDEFQLSFELPSDYLFIIGQETEPAITGAAEYLREGYREIASVFAQLAGRAELDLYRPMRL